MRQLPPRGANVAFSSFPNSVQCTPVNLTAADGAPSRGLLFRPHGVRPRVGVHLMHPRTDQSLNYNIAPLAEAGYAVLGRGGRSVNNDVDTVHEELLLDVAAGVRYLRGIGCEKVVLLGNSGGGSLACLYQSQATTPPADRLRPVLPYTSISLADADLPAADGLALIGIHLGEGLVLAKMIDPSVVDEADAVAADPELDMYDPANGFTVPMTSVHYDADFLTRYRQAQWERVRRLDTIARSAIERQLAAGAAVEAATGSRQQQRMEREAQSIRYLIVYRTTADPAMVDLAIDPDDRTVGGHDGNVRPDLQNWSHTGFAHYLTPRAWLSTWSGLESHAQTAKALTSIKEPTLVVHYAGDVYTRLNEARKIFESCAADDSTFVVVPHADHYGKEIVAGKSGQRRVSEGVDAVVKWMSERFPLTSGA